MQTLVGMFHSFEQAQRAVDDLITDGVPRDRISLMANNATGEYKRYATDSPTEDAVKAGDGAAFGAASGGVIGALLGLGALAIPGIGPVVAAGPLVAALTGGVVGAVAGAPTGGIVAALVKTHDLSEEEAQVYAEGVRRGDTLLTVTVDSASVARTREILDRNGSVDVRTQGERFRSSGWSRFDNEAAPYTADEVRAYRDASVKPPMRG